MTIDAAATTCTAASHERASTVHAAQPETPSSEDHPAVTAGPISAPADISDTAEQQPNDLPHGNAAESTADEWTPSEQDALELAMKRHPASIGQARWEMIAADVPGKTKAACIRRVKAIKAALAAKRTVDAEVAVATVDARATRPAAAAAPAAAPAPGLVVTCSSMCKATARGVGCSNTTVDDRATPVMERSREDSSVAASESTPASISGVSALSVDAGVPVSSHTTRSTADSVYERRWPLDIDAIVWASALPA